MNEEEIHIYDCVGWACHKYNKDILEYLEKKIHWYRFYKSPLSQMALYKSICHFGLTISIPNIYFIHIENWDLDDQCYFCNKKLETLVNAGKVIIPFDFMTELESL